MENTWITKDLYIAAFCLTKGMRLLTTKRVDGQVAFIFNESPDRESIISGYLNNSMAVPPRQYKESLQALKDIIFQGE
jgi:hypothetical protein